MHSLLLRSDLSASPAASYQGLICCPSSSAAGSEESISSFGLLRSYVGLSRLGSGSATEMAPQQMRLPSKQLVRSPALSLAP
jgi:hypothetical protein